ncbi:MAG: PAS domain S-box protein [Desulfobacter sp.]|nr:MAG: PAS domain S-box protein [Desulfobacter sp.]
MDDPKKIKARLEYLEEVNRSRIQALDMIRDIGGIHDSISRLEDPGTILETCRKQVRKLIPATTLAFYLVDEKSSDFNLESCTPAAQRDMVEAEIEEFIKDGTFSRAVLEKGPVIAGSRDFSANFLFHVLATTSRVRGMCVVVLEGNTRKVPDAALGLISILMTHCANALESHALYTQLKSANEMLREKVGQLSKSQSYLQNEVAAHVKTLDALGKSELQYRLLAESAREIIMTISEEGRILYVNPYCIALGKYGNGDLNAMDVNDVLEGVGRLDHRFSQGASQVRQASLVVKDGGRVPLEISIVPIAAGNGGELLVTGRDISEHLRAEAEKERLEERLWQARKMESIGLLAGGTAHDFNNLLGIIFNYTDLAVECLPEDHPAVSYLGHVETASNQARDLARQLYAIGREDHHQTSLIDVNKEMMQLMKLLKSSLGKKMTFVFEPGPDPLMVRAEATRIRQILMNLISNASHATVRGKIKMGGERVAVETGSFQEGLGITPGPFVRFWVKDSGTGIDPDTLPHIFEPYYSTKKEEGNAGLGLAVVHGIVKNYGGAVDVETSPPQGSCFFIYLPEAV